LGGLDSQVSLDHLVLLEALEPREKWDLQEPVDQMDHLDLTASVVNLDSRDLLERQDHKDHEAVMELVDRMDNEVLLDQLVIQVSNAQLTTLHVVRDIGIRITAN